MKKKNLNYIAALEKAIRKKYGEIAIQNPANSWTPEKEKEYLSQLQENIDNEEPDEAMEADGFLITKKLISMEGIQNCSFCNEQIIKNLDKIFYNKSKLCYKCSIKNEGKKNDDDGN